MLGSVGDGSALPRYLMELLHFLASSGLYITVVIPMNSCWFASPVWSSTSSVFSSLSSVRALPHICAHTLVFEDSETNVA